MNSKVQTAITTIIGKKGINELGITHPHEHLFLKKGVPMQVDPSLVIDDYEKTKNEVILAMAHGVQTIVDAQPIGAGRNAALLKKVSEESGLNIIACTGFHKLVFYKSNHWIHSASSEKLTELYVDELTNHLYQDGEDNWPSTIVDGKAGLIKTAADMQGVAGRYFSLFKAAATASKLTNTAIMSHTELGYHALEQISFYEKHDIAPEKLIICHLDRKTENLEYMLHVAESGVYIELDTIGRFRYHSDEDEIIMILRLLDKGHEDRILLSLDTTNKRMRHYDGGNFGLDYLQTTFLPILKKAGVSDSMIRKMTIDNAARALAK
ncbi:hypothetical protein FJQ98_07330 [Lysinibacillus agricola]|uniref:Phosphotriesterase n=1 Tax=Lysinibacillus agricola TaxID=2590012 RepID=A0ABX7AVL6_9BACI|nr:hypothetical protein [Lysinibacillus agricola]KOS62874.1 hypothetical protein AN161_11225 [Lysinibacillus sp. FJAT-14222]QQP13844.1 hypothetical protein FJQ98_07330 [Lysinibacillus agricola]